MPWSDLFHYWRSKHVDGRPPSRKDIDPLIDIPSLVANIMLIDREPAGYRNRLIGSAITRRVGQNNTGRLIDHELFGPTTLAIWRGILDEVCGTLQPKLAVVRIMPNDKVTMLTLILPLAGRNGEAQGLFSGCFFEGILAAPRRAIPLDPIAVEIPYAEANVSGGTGSWMRIA